jgi:putative redox protein
MEAIVKQVEGITWLGKADTGHWVAMDGPGEFGGNDAAPRPLELLLIGFAGCTGSDVASILAKKRAPLRTMEIRMQAERAETHPRVFTKIHIEYVFYGVGLKEKDIQRAIGLSHDKYCPASAMLRKAVEITHSYRIVDESGEGSAD